MNKIGTFSIIAAFLLTSCKGQAQPGEDLQFKKHILSSEFISEGVAAGDVNKDGKIDVIAGAYWFEAPSWTAHEIAKPQTFSVDKGYSNSMLNFSMDVNQDGWIDQIRIDFPGEAAYWHENPGNAEGEHWKVHTIFETVGNESPRFVDVDGDGRKDLLCADSKTKEMIWLRAPSKKGEVTWKRYAISETNAPGTNIFSHGLGFDDVNGDGKKDVLIKEGWWESPADPRQPGWKFHEASFGEACSQMFTRDFDGDGDLDVISASAHKFGVWWHEQDSDESGGATWETHEISMALSQTHATSLVDLNEDGHPDLVTGMRYFAHLGKDPGEQSDPLLVWFEFNPGAAPSWTLHEIDNDSGVGLNIVTEDITGDNLRDILVANKKGVFVFEQLK